MIHYIDLPPGWTQFHAVNHDTHVEVAIHFAGPWVRTGSGETIQAAVVCAKMKPAIAMGDDAPMLAEVARLEFRPEGVA